MARFSLRCPRCSRQISYIIRKTGEGICQVCGYVLSKEEVEQKVREQENNY